jgi:hypothetical protein
MGAWCYRCGQLGEDFHRSTLKLLFEAVEGLLHFDGRVWRTLPDLFLHPARLTRRYLDGHRAPQVPPLRLFLVVLLVFFFVGSIGDHGGPIVVMDKQGHVLSQNKLTPEQKDKVGKAISHVQVQFGSKPDPAAGDWLKDRLMKAIDDPERFKLVLEQWSERFAFLTLPLAAILMSLLFVFQRRFYLFDHIIFSLHSLSALGLLLALAIGLSKPTGGLSFLALTAAPVHLFFHMRGVYGVSVLGTAARMFLLFLGTCFGLGLIVVGLLWVGLNGMA